MPRKPKTNIAKRKPPEPTAAQVEQVTRWILSGARDADILASINDLWPNQPETPLITAAVRNLAAAARFDSDIYIGFCLEATRGIYARMMEIGDMVGALRAVKQLADLATKYGPGPDADISEQNE